MASEDTTEMLSPHGVAGVDWLAPQFGMQTPLTSHMPLHGLTQLPSA
jgi:hypothetical protein